MNILNDIIENKKLEVSLTKKTMPFDQLRDMSGYHRECISLNKSIQGRDIAVIAEIKKASPSRGVIREDFNPVQIAVDYVDGGAAGISVLTDRKYFQGHIYFINDIRPLVPLPILRKDFIIDSYQLAEAKAFGADAVLLIAAALESGKLRELYSEASELGLECLVEVHSEGELETLDLNTIEMVGINNRNLVDFKIDMSATLRIVSGIPAGITIVSESGIEGRPEIEKLAKGGVHAVLIGESLMRSANPKEALRSLLTSNEGQNR